MHFAARRHPYALADCKRFGHPAKLSITRLHPRHTSRHARILDHAHERITHRGIHHSAVKVLADAHHVDTHFPRLLADLA